MPFVPEIVKFIDDTLAAKVLNREGLLPQKFFGLADIVSRKKPDKPLENFPAVIGLDGKDQPIAPDSKMAIATYHRLLQKQYALEQKPMGDSYNVVCTMDMQLVVFTNAAITRKGKVILEPLFLFGLPQRLDDATRNELQLIRTIITPQSSNMDALSVFRTEWPQGNYFFNEQMSLFSIRYRVVTAFSQACIDRCLCPE